MQHATWQGADSPASRIETPRLLLINATPSLIQIDRNQEDGQEDFATAAGLQSLPNGRRSTGIPAPWTGC